jgi:hypothetical protein
MMNFRAWLLVACVSLGACSQHGPGDMRAAMVEPEGGEAETAVSTQQPVSGLSALFSQASSPAPLTTAQPPSVALASAQSFQPTSPEMIPGEFTAYNAPLPPLRPDFGDRLAATAEETQMASEMLQPPRASWLSALTGAFTPRETAVEQEEPNNAAQAQAHERARAASLVAFEHKEAGVPMPERPAARNRGANEAPVVITFTPANLQVAGVTAPPLRADGGPRWRAAYDEVETDCFPTRLRQALEQIGAHFNSEVLVTSGRRTTGRTGSLHRTCMAADIRVVGVAPEEVARVARTIPGVNGVGAYRHVALTHVDVRDERLAWRW